MNLKSQDVADLLKLVAIGSGRPTYATLAVDLCMSPSEVHASIARARQARLLTGSEREDKVHRTNFREFLFHGVRYAFVPECGEVTRGIPTGYAAPPLNAVIVPSQDPPPVWPWEEGNVRGASFSPLYPKAPKAALRDPSFYELMALTDALRGGSSRETQIARNELEKRLRAAE